MLNAGTVNVALFGISQREERMINIVLSHQKHSTTNFVPVKAAGSADCRIGLIDLDALNAEEARRELTVLQNADPNIKIIYVSNDGQRGDGIYRIAHKSLLSQLVLTLQDIAKTIATQSSVSAINTAASASPGEAATPSPAAPVQGLLRGSIAAARQSLAERVTSAGAYGMAPLQALVVDDSVTVRNQLDAALKDVGFITDLASSGDQAAAMMAKKRYDVVFLDVVLPGEDGYAICKAIRRTPVGKSRQVVMLTSRSSPFDRARGALAGCNMYLVKPLSLDVFYGAVEKVVGKIQAGARAALIEGDYQFSA
ncbi:response regulator [Tahibacter amnicola]|uniref:Response regulator n=1 Tax=Tahibacter amnicola TaxID=2976241 RepID=A0ABY6BKL4_9GAMM|nr:response regulator [Tahibacter amnicola]UXI70156.1 response regulator [Tahibacter amnicola]